MAVLPGERLVPHGVWLALAAAVVCALLLSYTRLGRHAVAVGSNELTARLCGVPVARVRLAIYTLGGLLAGLAGMLEFSTLTVGDPTDSVGLELEAIAAVVIGGGSLSGGQGSVAGTLIGALLAHGDQGRLHAPGHAQLDSGNPDRRHHRGRDDARPRAAQGARELRRATRPRWTPGLGSALPRYLPISSRLLCTESSNAKACATRSRAPGSGCASRTLSQRSFERVLQLAQIVDGALVRISEGAGGPGRVDGHRQRRQAGQHDRHLRRPRSQPRRPLPPRPRTRARAAPRSASSRGDRATGCRAPSAPNRRSARRWRCPAQSFQAARGSERSLTSSSKRGTSGGAKPERGASLEMEPRTGGPLSGGSGRAESETAISDP